MSSEFSTKHIPIVQTGEMSGQRRERKLGLSSMGGNWRFPVDHAVTNEGRNSCEEDRSSVPKDLGSSLMKENPESEKSYVPFNQFKRNSGSFREKNDRRPFSDLTQIPGRKSVIETNGGRIYVYRTDKPDKHCPLHGCMRTRSSQDNGQPVRQRKDSQSSISSNAQVKTKKLEMKMGMEPLRAPSLIRTSSSSAPFGPPTSSDRSRQSSVASLAGTLTSDRSRQTSVSSLDESAAPVPQPRRRSSHWDPPPLGQNRNSISKSMSGSASGLLTAMYKKLEDRGKSETHRLLGSSSSSSDFSASSGEMRNFGSREKYRKEDSSPIGLGRRSVSGSALPTSGLSSTGSYNKPPMATSLSTSALRGKPPAMGTRKSSAPVLRSSDRKLSDSENGGNSITRGGTNRVSLKLGSGRKLSLDSKDLKEKSFLAPTFSSLTRSLSGQNLKAKTVTVGSHPLRRTSSQADLTADGQPNGHISSSRSSLSSIASSRSIVSNPWPPTGSSAASLLKSYQSSSDLSYDLHTGSNRPQSASSTSSLASSTLTQSTTSNLSSSLAEPVAPVPPPRGLHASSSSYQLPGGSTFNSKSLSASSLPVPRPRESKRRSLTSLGSSAGGSASSLRSSMSSEAKDTTPTKDLPFEARTEPKRSREWPYSSILKTPGRRKSGMKHVEFLDNLSESEYVAREY